MKLKNYFLKLVIISLAFLSLACGDDEKLVKGQYASGIFIVNEGNFGSGNGSVSHYNPSDKTVIEDVFKAENDFALGDVVQSLHIDGDKAFIVVNNSKKIEVVNYGDFSSIATISENLANPRYMVSKDGKGYISNWGNFDSNFALDQSYVEVIDLKDFKEVKKINTQDGSENMIIKGNTLFVSNSFTNTVSAIDLVSGSISKTITVGNSPGVLIEDKTGMVWVVCAGSFGGNDGRLVSIDAQKLEVTQSIDLTKNVGSKITYNSSANEIYYYGGKVVYALKMGTTSPKVFLDISDFSGIYGIGFDESRNAIYVSDAVGFAGKGTVHQYETSGQLIHQFKVGVGPSGFVFIP
jgi:YVTN family beta-propeller protein